MSVSTAGVPGKYWGQEFYRNRSSHLALSMVVSTLLGKTSRRHHKFQSGIRLGPHKSFYKWSFGRGSCCGDVHQPPWTQTNYPEAPAVEMSLYSLDLSFSHVCIMAVVKICERCKDLLEEQKHKTY